MWMIIVTFKCVPTTKRNPIHSEQSPPLIHNRRWRWHHLSEKQLAAGRWLLSRLQLCGQKTNNRVFVPLILHMGARASSRPHLHGVVAQGLRWSNTRLRGRNRLHRRRKKTVEKINSDAPAVREADGGKGRANRSQIPSWSLHNINVGRNNNSPPWRSLALTFSTVCSCTAPCRRPTMSKNGNRKCDKARAPGIVSQWMTEELGHKSQCGNDCTDEVPQNKCHSFLADPTAACFLVLDGVWQRLTPHHDRPFASQHDQEVCHNLVRKRKWLCDSDSRVRKRKIIFPFTAKSRAL